MRKEIYSEFPSADAQKPALKPCGKLNIGIDDWSITPIQTIFHQEQRLSLYDATVTGEYELAGKAMSFEAFVYPQENVLLVKMEDTWVDEKLSFLYEQEISLSREIELPLGIPETGYMDGVMWLRYKFPDGFEYVMAMTVKGIELSEPEIYPDSVKVKAKLNYQNKRKLSYFIYLTVITSMDSPDPMKTAKRKLRQAEDWGYQKMKKDHNNWWVKF